MSVDPAQQKLAKRVLSAPESYPDEFKAWLSQYLAGNTNLVITNEQLPSIDKVHLVGATGSPGFAGAWANFGGGQRTAGFYLDPWGRVYLMGLVAGGALPSTIFTLPGNYRPEMTEIFAVIANNALGRVDINPDGTVVFTLGNSAYVQLNGISFKAF